MAKKFSATKVIIEPTKKLTSIGKGKRKTSSMNKHRRRRLGL